MIPYHHQAFEMAALVADRTNRKELIDVARRINAVQGDEIEFMQQWLRDRGQHMPDPTADDAMHRSHKMAGMATSEQMAEFAVSDGTAFDRMFLELMVPHHEGAVKMVKELLEQPGSAYDPVLFEFTSEVTSGQTGEIERMNVLLVKLSEDPRSALSAGFRDAGQARLNLALVASLPKAAGFYLPPSPLTQAMDTHASISGSSESSTGRTPTVDIRCLSDPVSRQGFNRCRALNLSRQGGAWVLGLVTSLLSCSE